jgi:hypothetical protein
VFWKPCSSCWSSHLLREELLSTPIHPLSGSPNWTFNWYQSWFGYLLTLPSLRPRDSVPGTGFESFTLRWEELLDVAEADVGVPQWKWLDPLGCHGEHKLCSSFELPCSRIEGHVRRQQQGSRLLVPCSMSIRIRLGSGRGLGVEDLVGAKECSCWEC